MAVAEQQLSPEEKLLKVIQGGGEAGKQPSPEEKLLSTVKPPAANQRSEVRDQRSEVRDQRSEAGSRKPEVAVTSAPAAVKPAQPPPVVKPSPPAAVVPQKPVEKPAAPKTPAVEAKPPVPAKIEEPKRAAEAKPPAAATDEKTKLKVLKSDPAPQEKEAPAKPLLGASGPVGIGGPVDISSAGRSGGKFSMGAVNRGLAAAVLLILAFTAYEIWAAVKEAEVSRLRPEATAAKEGQPGDGAITETGSPADLPALASYVDPWKTKDIFYQTTVKTGGEQASKTGAPKPELAGRLKVIGFSKQPDKDPRVILRDTKDDKMFIVGTGEKILVGDQPLELVQIHNDHVVFSDGNDSISISVK